MILPLGFLRALIVAPGSPVQNPAMLFNKAYQAADPSKPGFISITVNINQAISLLSTVTEEVELRIGPDSNVELVTNPTGIAVAVFRKSIKGIAVAVGLEIGQGGQICTALPAGWYYAVRRLQGTTATITQAMVQPLT